MPLQFRYAEDEGILYARATGDIAPDDFWKARIPRVPLGTPELFDARGVTRIDMSSSEIRRLAEYERAGEHRISCMAILTDSDVAFGLSRMFQLLAAEVDYQIQVFRSEAEARDWLEERRG